MFMDFPHPPSRTVTAVLGTFLFTAMSLATVVIPFV